MLIRSRLPLWVVIGLVLAAYIGVGNAGYVWDDHGLLEHNSALDAPTFDKIWRRDLWCCVGTNTTGYYRPLLTMTFLLDRLLFGVDPAGAHVQSLMWHVGVVLLVSALLRGRVGAVRANVAALLFGLHPIQSETVVWISARNDLMAAAGVLATLWALDRRRHVLAAGLALAACLSKENAFLLPAVAWLWRRAWGERLERRDWLALAGGLTLALALRSQAALDGPGLEDAEISFTLQSAVYAAGTLASWLLMPWPLTTTASLYMRPPGPAVWIAAAAGVGMLGWLLWHGGRKAAWLLLISAVVLVPSAFGVRWYATLGERYLYLPLFGLVATIVATVPERRRYVGALVVATVLALGVLFVRIPDWADDEALLTAAVRRAPDAFSWNLLGVEMMRQHRLAEAARPLDIAIMSDPMQRRACRYIVPASDTVLEDADFLARSAAWSARGCSNGARFRGSLALALAGRGYWDQARATLASAGLPDPERRDLIVRAALAARDGDIEGLSAIALSSPGGPSYLLDQVASLTQNVHGFDPAPAPTP